MSCTACESAATDKWSVYVNANCPACVVRSVAKAPPSIQARYIDRLAPADKAQFTAELDAEIQRRKAMPDSSDHAAPAPSSARALKAGA